MKRSSSAGITFVEILITIFVLTSAIIGALLFFASAMAAVQYAKDLTIATSHADNLFEEMESRATLANITGTDWTAWYASQNSIKLPSEVIHATFTNTAADPLEISLDLRWVSRSRPMSETFVTRMTK